MFLLESWAGKKNSTLIEALFANCSRQEICSAPSKPTLPSAEVRDRSFNIYFPWRIPERINGPPAKI